MKKNLIPILLLTPTLASAQQFQNLGDVLEWVLGLVNSYFIPILIGLALISFFWRNVVALAKKDELAQKAELKWYLFWGVIALFVMVSVWGLVGILADTFGIQNAVPQLDTGSGGNNNDDGDIEGLIRCPDGTLIPKDLPCEINFDPEE